MISDTVSSTESAAMLLNIAPDGKQKNFNSDGGGSTFSGYLNSKLGSVIVAVLRTWQVEGLDFLLLLLSVKCSKTSSLLPCTASVSLKLSLFEFMNHLH